MERVSKACERLAQALGMTMEEAKIIFQQASSAFQKLSNMFEGLNLEFIFDNRKEKRKIKTQQIKDRYKKPNKYIQPFINDLYLFKRRC